MPWNNRIREPAYNSPSGARLTFGYEDVRREFDKKTTGFVFPDANGTFVQDLGHTGRRYPLRVFFWGDDHDQEANAFEEALQETGVGRLEHPMYGVVDVVPFGIVTRRDNLKTAANQSIIEVTFWETTDVVYPTSQADPASSVLSAIGEYNVAASEAFSDALGLDTAIERVTLENSYLALLDSASDNLQGIADTQDDVRRQFNAIVDSVNQGIDVLISDPLTLASQTTQLIQAPARAATSISARLEAYSNLAESIITGENSVAETGNDDRNSNQFHTNDLYASSYVTGSVVSTVNTQFVTKAEALQAADSLLSQLDDVVDWRDENFASLEQVDTGESYQKLQNAVAVAAGFLVEISFSLKQERSIVLDRARTVIDLAAELYGAVDSELDFLITSNDLSGSEILELPRGKEIVYYI